MNEIKIPKSFMLMGHKIEVIQSDDLNFQDDAWGKYSFRHRRIELQQRVNGYQIDQEHIEETYLHELVHSILFRMEQNELGQDEGFVNVFAGLLYQALKTADYSNYTQITSTITERTS